MTAQFYQVSILLFCLNLQGLLHADPSLGAKKSDELVIPVRPALVTARGERAIEKGLAYLASKQSPNGAWRENSSSYSNANTALAGLALMAGGNTPVSGKYALQVRRTVDYFMGIAEADGLIANRNEESRPMYSHGFAMLLLAQAYGMEPDPDRQRKLAEILKRAVALTAKSQSKKGGWYYHPEDDDDEGSVTVTQIQALRACRNAGIKVDKKVIQRACQYISLSQNKDGGVRYQAKIGLHGSRSRPAISIAAVAVMYNAGEYEHPSAKKALDYTKNLIRRRGLKMAFAQHRLYAWLYASQAFYLSGDKLWEKYFPDMLTTFVRDQRVDGSWAGDGVGKIYGTSVALMILQVPYQTLPILQR